MKKKFRKLISILVCLSLIITIGSTAVCAADGEEVTAPTSTTQEQVTELAGELVSLTTDTVKGLFAGMAPLNSWDNFLDNVMKVLYNLLNVIVEVLVKSICTVYPNPSDWKQMADNNEIILKGDDIYRTAAAQGSRWSLGYASRSLVPEDIDSGKYNLGRDLNNKPAKGVYDDMRIRVSVIDDNSGDGASVFGAIDCLGVTAADVRSIRKGVLDYCAKKGFDVSTVDISATHCHSALDTQGVSTQFFYKLFANFFNNFFGIFTELPGLESATYFKNYFIEQSILAVEEAFADVEDGRLFYDVIDSSAYVKDKRHLVAPEKLPPIVALKFVPDSGSEDTYICNITCHPTSFSANNGLVTGDYIYYADKYIKEQTGANLIIVQGALGQVSREIDVDYTGLTEYEQMSAQSDYLGKLVGADVIGAAYTKELAPILNVRHEELMIYPENSILTLACEIKLVNNPVYYTDKGCAISSEIGYMEFGHEVGFAMFPGELYPETFWGGSELIGDVNWDGTQWPYPSLHNSVDGVKVYPISLCDDATGYVVTDNNFAFMGHIIGDGVADEVLSVGKHEGSYLVSNYLELVEDFVG